MSADFAKRALKLAVMMLTAAVTVTGCTLRENRHYRVTSGGNGIYATIFEKPTNQIIQLRRLCALKHGEPATRDIPTWCVADVLWSTTRFDGWGAAEWNDGLSWHVIPDMRDNLNNIEPTVGDLNDTDNRCLGLHKGWNGDLNWFDRAPNDSNCLEGAVFDP